MPHCRQRSSDLLAKLFADSPFFPTFQVAHHSFAGEKWVIGFVGVLQNGWTRIKEGTIYPVE
jgi:hypothetical protein